MKQIILAVLFCVMTFPATSNDFAATRAKLEAAVNSSIRTEKEKRRDANRKPVETMEFLGLRDSMKVVDIIPGGGWYTKILAPVLHEKGEYIASVNANRVRDQILSLPGFERGKVVREDARYWREKGDPFLTANVKTLNIDNADMVLNFRNYANFDEKGREEVNSAILKALKPGGIYGVICHTARHMEPHAPHNTRRFDPVLAIKEVTSIGFDFVDYSRLHFHSEDKLSKKINHKEVVGKTDRWTLKFRKPHEDTPPTIPTTLPQSAPLSTLMPNEVK